MLLVVLGLFVFAFSMGLAAAAFWIDGGRPVLPADDRKIRPAVTVKGID